MTLRIAAAGTVAARRSALSLGGMRTDAGVSLSFMTINATAVHVDIGTGGGEGVRVFLSIGPVFRR